MSAQPTVDWAAAGRLAGRLVLAGPTPSAGEAAAYVASLRRAARRARRLALDASGLASALERPGAITGPAQVLIVDRPGWAKVAAGSFGGMTPDRALPGTTAQAGSVLALLATRVLGQFDPYGPGPAAGRLVVVAPNVLHAERSMGVMGRDFRLWVCAHEQTHALQFAAAPWLAGHLRAEVDALVGELLATPPGDEVSAVLAGIARSARRDRSWSVLDALPPAQREIVERVTAVMSLLEGHADVTMDEVRGIPTAPALRSRFERRRASRKPLDLLLRRLVGLDVKLAQYRDGAAFVRAVREQGGEGALDAIWTAPEALPQPSEIADAGAWLRRVHG